MNREEVGVGELADIRQLVVEEVDASLQVLGGSIRSNLWILTPALCRCWGAVRPSS